MGCPRRLTALVLRVLALARPYLPVDSGGPSVSLRWLLGQQRPNGAFQEKEPVLHREMQVGTRGPVISRATSRATSMVTSMAASKVTLRGMSRATSRATSRAHLLVPLPWATFLVYLPGSRPQVTCPCHLSVICHHAMSPSHVLVSPPFLQPHEGSLRHGPVQCPRAISPAMSPLEAPVRHFVPLPCPPISCPSPVSLCPQGSVADPGPEATVSLTAFVVVALQGARGLLPPDSRDHVHLVSLHVPTGPCVPSPCPLPMSPLTVPTQPL